MCCYITCIKVQVSSNKDHFRVHLSFSNKYCIVIYETRLQSLLEPDAYYTCLRKALIQVYNYLMCQQCKSD